MTTDVPLWKAKTTAPSGSSPRRRWSSTSRNNAAALSVREVMALRQSQPDLSLRRFARYAGASYWRPQDFERSNPARHQRSQKHETSRGAVRKAALEHPTYGYRFLYQELCTQGNRVGLHRVSATNRTTLVSRKMTSTCSLFEAKLKRPILEFAKDSRKTPSAETIQAARSAQTPSVIADQPFQASAVHPTPKFSGSP